MQSAEHRYPTSAERKAIVQQPRQYQPDMAGRVQLTEVTISQRSSEDESPRQSLGSGEKSRSLSPSMIKVDINKPNPSQYSSINLSPILRMKERVASMPPHQLQSSIGSQRRGYGEQQPDLNILRVPAEKLKSVATLLDLVRGNSKLNAESIGSILDVVSSEVDSLISNNGDQHGRDNRNQKKRPRSKQAQTVIGSTIGSQKSPERRKSPMQSPKETNIDSELVKYVREMEQVQSNKEPYGSAFAMLPSLGKLKTFATSDEEKKFEVPALPEVRPNLHSVNPLARTATHAILPAPVKIEQNQQKLSRSMTDVRKHRLPIKINVSVRNSIDEPLSQQNNVPQMYTNSPKQIANHNMLKNQSESAKVRPQLQLASTIVDFNANQFEGEGLSNIETILEQQNSAMTVENDVTFKPTQSISKQADMSSAQGQNSELMATPEFNNIAQLRTDDQSPNMKNNLPKSAPILKQTLSACLRELEPKFVATSNKVTVTQPNKPTPQPAPVAVAQPTMSQLKKPEDMTSEELLKLKEQINKMLGEPMSVANTSDQAFLPRERSQTEEMASRLQIVFLHASPNILKGFGRSDKRDNIAPAALDFRQEQKVIKKAVADAGRQITFRAAVATKEAFQRTIYGAPDILHISCHGICNNDRQYLLFENEYGGGEMVEAAKLEELISFAEDKIKLVFIAACDSETIGELFKKSGIEHIICIKSKRFVLDEAAIKFTKTFYDAIFKGSPVCDAYNAAKHATEFNMRDKNEVSLFTLLRASDYVDIFDPTKFAAGEHQCQGLRCDNRGQWQCVSEHNMIKYIPTRLTIKFRERETSEILQSFLTNKERILQLCGLQGIGKSSLAREAMHYAAERKMFLGGQVFIQCKEITTNKTLLKLILRASLKIFDLTYEEKTQLLETLCTEDQYKDFLKDVFNGKNRQYKLKKQSLHTSIQKENNLSLLCLDNVESMIKHDENDAFGDFLGELFDECEDLCILTTSSVTLGALPNNQIVPEVQFVESLRNSSAAQLFWDRCGPLETKDLVDWILSDANYPYKKLLTATNEKNLLSTLDKMQQGEHDAQIKDELIKKVNTRGQVEWMAHHDMFRHMAGNPTSLTMISSACRNRNLKVEDGDNCLIYMYKRLLEGKNTIIEEVDGEGGKRRKNRVENQMISLEVTTRMSIALLEGSSNSEQDIEVLYFLGCLPGGVTDDQLQKMLEKPVRSNLDKLQKLCFLEDGVHKYQLTTSMLQHIDTVLQKHANQNRKFSYMQIICSFYRDILKESYKVIGRSDTLLNDLFQQSSEPDLLGMSQPKLKSYESKMPLDELNQKRKSTEDYLLMQVTNEQDIHRKNAAGKILSEMRNIQNCFRGLVKYSVDHAAESPSKIYLNKGYSQNWEDGSSTESKVIPQKQVDFREGEKLEKPRLIASKSQDFASNPPLRRQQKLLKNPVVMPTKRVSISQTQKAAAFKQYDTTKLHKELEVVKENSASDNTEEEESGLSCSSSDISPKNNGIIVGELNNKTNGSLASQSSSNKLSLPKQAKPGQISLTQKLSFSRNNEEAKNEVSDAIQEGVAAMSRQAQIDIFPGRVDSLNFGGRRMSVGDTTSDSFCSSNQSSECEDNDDQPIFLKNMDKKLFSTIGSQSKLDLLQVENFDDDIKKAKARRNTSDARKSAAPKIGSLVSIFNQEPIDAIKRRATEKRASAQGKQKRLEKSLQEAQNFKTTLKLSQKMVDKPPVHFAVAKKKNNKRKLMHAATTDEINIGIPENHTLWRSMTTNGEFIILLLADTFLTHDYEGCLLIATQDFSYVANSSIFEGNILRFLSLASFKAFEHATHGAIDDNACVENFGLIIQALKSSEQALLIYQGNENDRERQIGGQNLYGMALANFTLGYIYDKFAKHLNNETVIKQNKTDEKYDDYLLGSEKQYKTKADHHYEEAYGHFKQVKHYMGSYLSKKGHYETYAYDDDDSDAEQEMRGIEILLEKIKRKLKDFSTIDNAASCFIPREHGLEISLMAEIVFKCPTESEPLFNRGNLSPPPKSKAFGKDFGLHKPNRNKLNHMMTQF